MKIKLLITGGLGYIGSFTAKNYLEKTKTKSISIDNLSRGNNFAKKYSKNFKLDISKKKVLKIIQNHKIDTVLHLASLTCVRESIKKKEKYYKNYQSQIKFIKFLKKSSVRYFIFSSSQSIFEKNKIKSNLSPYSKNKIKIEKFLKKISSSKFKVIILRYPNVIGSDPKGELGEKNSKISRIVPLFYKNIIQKKRSYIFYNFKKKSFPKRNYMHVEDIANTNIKVIKSLKNFKKNFHIFNLNNKKQYSNIEIFFILSKLLKKNTHYTLKQINDKESMYQLHNSRLNISKYINFNLNYTDLKKILKSNLKWFEKIF